VRWRVLNGGGEGRAPPWPWLERDGEGGEWRSERGYWEEVPG